MLLAAQYFCPEILFVILVLYYTTYNENQHKNDAKLKIEAFQIEISTRVEELENWKI